MAYFTTDDGVQLFYKDEGSGEKTLVMLAGFSGNTEHYYKVAPTLAKRYRVVRMDKRAHGRSETPKYGYTMERMAQDIKNLIDHLALKNVTLIGWSTSSEVIYAYVKLYGDAGLDKIVISVMSPKCFNTPDYNMGMLGFTHESFFDYVYNYSTNFLNFMDMTYNGTFAYPEESKEDRAWIHEDMKVLDPGAMIRVLTALAAVDYWDVLPTITKPTLILEVEHDIFPQAAMEEQAKRIKNSKYVLLEDCGHMHALERPEAYIKAITEFVG